MQKDGVVKQLVLTHDTEVSVSTFYSRTLRGQTHWKYVASLPEGDIYRPVDTVLTVESGNVHEAYIVVHDRELVGYYLPVEANFVTLAPVVALDFNTIN